MKHLFTWNGHSNFTIQSDDKTILLDPFFEGNPKACASWDTVKKADAVLVTHDHGDHVGQAAEICNATGAELVCIFDFINDMISQGVSGDKIIGMNIGGTIEVSGIKVKMVQAMHSSASGAPAGFIITYPDDFCVYFAGDTGLFSSMELFGKLHDIDVAVLPTGGWFTMDSKDAAYACKMLQCKKVIPMHYGTFPILEQNAESFIKNCADLAPDCKVIELEIGNPTEINS
ncbi:metal-dependent hydrolase [Maridesulfovibrio zosterae]|uniref:metal-dependent hydrolase n=1 Tax=Maridesulfovibrio zosterae TaxID=82171 RepID=UPI00041DB48E|nr:metal-dependent hydrolase [Maridesulfovibrio zosterae]